MHDLTWQTQLDWLLKLARYEVNGVYPWKAYAWHRAKELEAEGDLWTGISEALRLSMQETTNER
jgi:hypothetical protein